MSYVYSDYRESAEALREKLGGFAPEVLLILGSGLGFLGDEVENPVFVPYGEIPHCKASTAPGHKGRFAFGTLRSRRVAVMQGRMHCYEGYTMEDAGYAVRVLRLLGADKLIVTNAAGAVNQSFVPGDLMLITDHIKLFGFGPLQGANVEEFGTRFPDMSAVYAPRLRELARSKARELGLTLREGIYMYFPGPQFETPAEVRAARVLGADAVGMSTVPEAIVAAHCGYEILGITLLANMAAGCASAAQSAGGAFLTPGAGCASAAQSAGGAFLTPPAGVLPQPLSGEEVNAMAEASAPRFSSLILSCLADM